MPGAARLGERDRGGTCVLQGSSPAATQPWSLCVMLGHCGDLVPVPLVLSLQHLPAPFTLTSCSLALVLVAAIGLGDTAWASGSAFPML